MMTNFTWYEQYKQLNFPKHIIDVYKEIESSLDELWLYPFAFPLNHISSHTKQLGFQCRPFDYNKINDLRRNHNEIVSILTGMFASSNVKVIKFLGLIIHSEQVKVDYDGPKLMLNRETLDTHNYIAASDLVITKAGWSTVSEAIVSQTRMVLLERPSAFEDTYIIEQVKNLGYGISIKESELMSLDLFKLSKKYDEVIKC